MTGIMSRRQLIGAGAGLVLLNRTAHAASVVNIGTLCPVTGSGASVGSVMEQAVRRQLEKINSAGPVGGFELRGYFENSETDPNAAVIAAKKLITVDGVAAVLGEWASGETLAVSPICIANKIVQFTSCGDDKVTDQAHGGYIFRTEAGGVLWGRTFSEAAWGAGARKVAVCAVQASFAKAYTAHFKESFEEHGGRILGEPVFYAAGATTYRGEIERILANDPELILCIGYTLDTVILIKEAYRAGAKAKWLVPGYVGLDPELVKIVGKEAVEGLVTIDLTPNRNSKNWRAFADLMGTERNAVSYAAQTYDQITLIGLAIEQSKGSDGTAVRDGIRKVTAPGGKVVTSFGEGVAELRRGNMIKYEGVSSPCEFDAKGNITSANFVIYEIRDGKPMATAATAVSLT
jgi:branched-chain amino acid transport system substrate-binding protein